MSAFLKKHLLPVCCVLLALLTGCGSTHSQPAGGKLPELPAGRFDTRRPAQLQVTHLNGDEAVAYSASAETIGSDLRLTAAPGGLEWAIWRLTPAAGADPKSVSVSLDLSAGSSAWIGLADYGSGTWDLNGPYAQDGARVAALSMANISPGGNIFVLACAFDGTQLSVTGLDIELDVPLPPKLFITGKLKDDYRDIVLAGKVVTLTPGGLQATTGYNGFYTFTDLNPGTYTVTAPEINGYTIAVPSQEVTLATDNFVVPDFNYMPVTQDITYTSAVKALLDSRCVECHDGTHPGTTVRLDSYLRPDSNDVYHHAENSLLVIEAGFMPPSPPAFTFAERQLIDDWINVFNKAE
jgi:hypothetical protein